MIIAAGMHESNMRAGFSSGIGRKARLMS